MPMAWFPRFIIVALTAAAFAGLRAAGWLGALSLVALMAILVTGGVLTELSVRWAAARGRFGILIVVPMLSVGTVIYCIGWGPALAIGYLFPLSESVKVGTSPPWKLGYAAALASMAGGELATATGLVHSYIPSPYDHALALLATMGLGFVIHMLASLNTARQAATAGLAEREESFRLMFLNNPRPMWVYDEQSLAVLSVNDAAVALYGFSEDTWLNMSIVDLRPQAQRASLLENLGRARDDLEHSGPWQHQLADGTIIEVEITSHRVSYLGRPGVLVMATDVTERNRLERRLRHNSDHDELTDLGNRRALRERLEAAEDHARTTGTAVALLVIDLDRFHEINGALGSAAGDDVLRQVAQILVEHIGRPDDVARVGSDEFAVVASLGSGAVLAEARTLAEDVLRQLSRPLAFGATEISVEASIGVALGPGPEGAATALVPSAQDALVKAKTSLGRLELIDLRGQRFVEHRVAVVAELRRAIEHGDLCLHFQPKVSLVDGAVVGMEALVRWQHSTRGLLYPDAFIPLAERTGLMKPLTAFVVQEAITQLAGWRAAGFDLTVAVNLGTANLTDVELPDAAASQLARACLPGSALVFEITEGTAMVDSERTLAVVHQLSEAGIELSIDDFGMAHSSLARLRDLPISEIKLDKTFVAGMVHDHGALTIVRSSIHLAHDLGMRVVAEGIESAEVATMLTGLGCDIGQGYWLARPMPADAVVEWLDQAVGSVHLGSGCS